MKALRVPLAHSPYGQLAYSIQKARASAKATEISVGGLIVLMYVRYPAQYIHAQDA